MNDCPSAAPPSRWPHWLREPLWHFLLVGALLFGLSAWRDRGPVRAPGAQRIVLTEADVLQLAAAWREQGFPEPGPELMQSLLEAKIREEVLYREALARGLDQDDVTVKRHLAQKLDFLAEDLSALREPGREELQAWFTAHAAEFARPPRATFRHVYFSLDEHGEKTRAVAAAALAKIAGRPADAPEAAALGDPFMFQNAYADRTPDQVAAGFGGKFAGALFALPPGTWAGPIESGFGWHLVFIEELTPGRVPEFAEVAAEVKAEWVASQRAELKEREYAALRAKYEVVLPKTATRENGVTGANRVNGDVK